MGKDGEDFPDDTVRGDHREIGGQAGVASFVDEDGVQADPRTAGDDLSGDRVEREALLEVQNCAQTLGFRGLLGELLELVAGGHQLGAQLLVVLLRAPEVPEVAPRPRGRANHAAHRVLKRAQNGDRPYFNQAHVVVAIDLEGEQQQLRYQHRHQHKEGAMLPDEGLHLLRAFAAQWLYRPTQLG